MRTGRRSRCSSRRARGSRGVGSARVQLVDILACRPSLASRLAGLVRERRLRVGPFVSPAPRPPARLSPLPDLLHPPQHVRPVVALPEVEQRLCRPCGGVLLAAWGEREASAPALALRPRPGEGGVGAAEGRQRAKGGQRKRTSCTLWPTSGYTSSWYRPVRARPPPQGQRGVAGREGGRTKRARRTHPASAR